MNHNYLYDQVLNFIPCYTQLHNEFAQVRKLFNQNAAISLDLAYAK